MSRFYQQQSGRVRRFVRLCYYAPHAGRKQRRQASISVDGDMPQHGHGLPTRPQVTKHLGNGDYLAEGMKFQMGGWWVVDFTIDAAGQKDTVRFNMILK